MPYSILNQRLVKARIPCLVILFLHIGMIPGLSQNLVPNPGFERHSDCPVGDTHFPLQFVKDWKANKWKDSNSYEFTHSPDFFHKCAKEKYGQPNNFHGKQPPFEGDGYAGIIIAKVQTKEFLQVKLKKPLKKGQSYYIKARVSLADRCTFGTNTLGALLSDQSDFFGNNQNYTPLKPLKGDPNRIIEEKKEWTLIAGCYKAKGEESHLTLGNFLPKGQTQTIWVKNTTDQDRLRQSYYYVDNVNVFPCKELADCPCKKLAYQGISRTLDTITKTQDSAHLDFVNILFKTAEATILNNSYQLLDQLAAFMNERSEASLIINGHTDERGSKDYNMDLSKRRAKAIYKYLQEKGITSERMSYKGYGSKNPVASNKTPRGRKLNRRVEFTIINQ